MIQKKPGDIDSIQVGTDIPLPEHGKVADWLFNKSGFLRQVISAAVAFLNLDVIIKYLDGNGNIVSNQRVRPVITGKNATLTLALQAANGSSGAGGTVPFSGAGAPSATTLAAGIAYQEVQPPSMYVDVTNLALWVCTTAGTNATSVWSQISSGGSSSVLTQYKITAIFNTYVMGQAAGGGLFYIFKPYELIGNLASEVIDGETIIYSNYTLNFNQRTATDAANNTEFQYITPRYTVGQYIFGMPVSGIPNPPENPYILEISPSRQWGGVN